MIDFIRQYEHMAVYLIFRQTESNDIKVRLRAKNNFNVAAFAAKFGGGGHKMAAGIRFKQASLESTVRSHRYNST